MGAIEDPFAAPDAQSTPPEFTPLRGAAAPAVPLYLSVAGSIATGCLSGFDLTEQPLITGLEALPGQIVAARTTVPLYRRMIGARVVVLYEAADPRQPIIVGVIQPSGIARDEPVPPAPPVAIQTDDERFVLSAEREIVLRCGDASITLTRAGKVIITGNYILSRSRGCNKLKGAAIELN